MRYILVCAESGAVLSSSNSAAKLEILRQELASLSGIKSEVFVRDHYHGPEESEQSLTKHERELASADHIRDLRKHGD